MLEQAQERVCQHLDIETASRRMYLDLKLPQTKTDSIGDAASRSDHLQRISTTISLSLVFILTTIMADEMDVDVDQPKNKGKKEGKESGKPRFEVKKVCI